MQQQNFKYLFDQYYNVLCNYVAHHFQMHTDAEDIVMDVFTHMWSINENLPELASPKAYLFRAVHNKALEKIRHKTLNIYHLNENIDFPEVFEEDNSEKYLLKEKVFDSIRHLPNQCRIIFVKAKIDGLSYKQIASELNLSVKTIESQMTKALKIVKENCKK